jgi:uncharacterized membrane-anchored protein
VADSRDDGEPVGQPQARRAGSAAAWQKLLLAFGAVLVFGLFNWSLVQKEALLRNGRIVRLALAPVDPRAFMTGDYMALNYALAAQAGNLLAQTRRQDGFAVVTVDDRQVAALVRMQDAPAPVSLGEQALRVRLRAGRARIGTDAFYFQEGTAKQYEAAKYGEFRVDASGQMLLIGLLDESLQALR